MGKVYKKIIANKEYYVYQYREGNKQYSKSISEAEAYEISFKNGFLKENDDYEEFINHQFHSKVIVGKRLFESIISTRKYNKRYIFENLKDYLDNDYSGKVFILYGLRRTGKTTLIFQSILGLPMDELHKVAYLKAQEGESFYDLQKDLDYLYKHGIRYFYIDEVTLLEQFIDMASDLSDFYALNSKVILSGTDSLSFLFAESDELYDRTIMVHSTYISYKEFFEVLGIDSIDQYIEYGGTMVKEGINYNQINPRGNNEYVDTAIAHNVVHSLKLYKDGDHFSHLFPLYEKGELVNVINRIIEDRNHRFALDTINRTFKSHDYGSLKNLVNKSISPLKGTLDNVNEDELLNDLMAALTIINIEDRKVPVDENVIKEVEAYLDLLDLCKEVDEVNGATFEIYKRKVFIQPGLRYAQAKTFVDILFKQPSIYKHPKYIKDALKEKILSDVKGRMLEEIALYQTSLKKESFKFLFAVGEYDMVTIDEEDKTTNIYEIKYSKDIDYHQRKTLLNNDYQTIIENAYYPIKDKVVLYRGENVEIDGVKYINVNDYLKSL